MHAATDISEVDAGPRRLAAGVERMCAVTRQVKPIDEMIRFVAGPDRALVPDLKRKLPGRGVWVTASRAAIADAVKRRVFARGLGEDVKADADLPGRIDVLLGRAALDALGVAHKAGLVAIGAAKTESALEREAVVGLIHAADARPDGVRKLDAAARRRFGEEADALATVAAFTSEQLDLALGRSNVVHAALLAGSASKAFLLRCGVLARFRVADGPGGLKAARRSRGRD